MGPYSSRGLESNILGITFKEKVNYFFSENNDKKWVPAPNFEK